MERREAPGACEAPWGLPCDRETQRALLGRGCESHPEARAGGDLKACEASPPNRCASRRSTAQAVKPAEKQTALSAARPLLRSDTSGRRPRWSRVRWRLAGVIIVVTDWELSIRKTYGGVENY